MNHADHVGLIHDGVAGVGPRWLELGAGAGAFSLALADLLGRGGRITALDRDPRALGAMVNQMAGRFPDTAVETVVDDFRRPLPRGPFDGILAANCLHFVADPVAVLRAASDVLRANGRIVVVEYDADRGNVWVPHPFSSRRFGEMALDAGLANPREIGRVPSRFLGAIYAAAADAPGERPDPVLDSAPHGADREE